MDYEIIRKVAKGIVAVLMEQDYKNPRSAALLGEKLAHDAFTDEEYQKVCMDMIHARLKGKIEDGHNRD